MGIIVIISMMLVLGNLLLIGFFFLNLEIVDILRFIRKDMQIKTLLGLNTPEFLLDKINEKPKTLKEEKVEPKTEA